MNLGFIDWVDGITIWFLCRVSDSTTWVSQELDMSSPPTFSLLVVALNLFYISWTPLYISMSSKICPLAMILILLNIKNQGPPTGRSLWLRVVSVFVKSYRIHKTLKGLASRAPLRLSWLDVCLCYRTVYIYMYWYRVDENSTCW